MPAVDVVGAMTSSSNVHMTNVLSVISSPCAILEFLGDTGVCQGDSGGPALDAEGRVISVVSRGGAGCSSPIYGAVYGWAQWIKDTTASAAISAGLDVPLWTRGFSTSPEFNYPVGDACTDGSQCPSGICQACTRVCSENGPCPDGYDCHPQRLVCLPNSLDTTNPSPSGSGDTEEKSDDGGCASANGTPLALLGIWWARRRKRRGSFRSNKRALKTLLPYKIRRYLLGGSSNCSKSISPSDPYG